jgi:hypothetical protein
MAMAMALKTAICRGVMFFVEIMQDGYTVSEEFTKI